MGSPTLSRWRSRYGCWSCEYDQGIDLDPSRPWDTVDFVLDGRDLRDWLIRLAPPEGRDHGHYVGHHVSTDFRALLHGQGPDGAHDDDGRTALLGCNCTIVDCGSLVCEIRLDSTTVTWSRFSLLRGPNFDYEPVEFAFGRPMYDDAMEEFARTRPVP